jgi:hypothetical protein
MIRDNITGQASAPDTHYRDHTGGVSSEIVHPSGAIRCYGTDADGYLVTMQYMGYTRREAVAMFRADMAGHWERIANALA